MSAEEQYKKMERLLKEKQLKIRSNDPEESIRTQLEIMKELGMPISEEHKQSALRGATLRKNVMDIKPDLRVDILGFALASEAANQYLNEKEAAKRETNIVDFIKTCAKVITTFTGANQDATIRISNEIIKLAMRNCGADVIIDTQKLERGGDEEGEGNQTIAKPPNKGMWS